jgi:preprotein translocase subunit SecF
MWTGVPVRLREVAGVEDAWRKVTRIVRVNGVPGVRMSVSKQSGKNTVEVARLVLKEIERINRDIPQLRVTPILDTSDYIQRSITNVGRAAMYGGLYAVLVLLVFLRSIRSTVVIAAAMPISIVATFMLVYFGGFTLNLVSLGGLALGVGMLVDNSIVVLENIHRLREGSRHGDAVSGAVLGTEEVASAIVASTLTTVVVFLPLIFVRGMAGVLFRQLAYVVSFALLCSLAVALTLLPMLASRFPHRASLDAGGRETALRRASRITGRLLAALEDRYRRLLHAALDHRLAVTAAAVLLLAGSAALMPFVGTELMPAGDEGEVRVTVEMEVGTRLSLLDETVGPIEQIITREVPEARNIATSLGGMGWRAAGTHVGEIRVALVPQRERRRSSEDIAAALRRRLTGIPGTTVRTRAGQGLFILRMGTSGADQVQVEVRGYNLQTAEALARRVNDVVEDVDGVTDARISLESGRPERLVVVDRAKAEAMRVTVAQVAGALETALGGTRAGCYRDAGDEYAILPCCRADRSPSTWPRFGRRAWTPPCRSTSSAASWRRWWPTWRAPTGSARWPTAGSGFWRRPSVWPGSNWPRWNTGSVSAAWPRPNAPRPKRKPPCGGKPSSTPAAPRPGAPWTIWPTWYAWTWSRPVSTWSEPALRSARPRPRASSRRKSSAPRRPSSRWAGPRRYWWLRRSRTLWPARSRRWRRWSGICRRWWRCSASRARCWNAGAFPRPAAAPKRLRHSPPRPGNRRPRRTRVVPYSIRLSVSGSKKWALSRNTAGDAPPPTWKRRWASTRLTKAVLPTRK